MQTLELLAPAKNVDCGIAAIEHGADAVYIGAPSFGARVAASNSVNDIQRLTTFAHQFGAKVYVTVNTILYDTEFDDVAHLLKQLNDSRVDALLVQDMGLLPLCHDVPLHASTQTDNRSVEKIRWLHEMGFQRVVLARELTLDEIREIHAAVPDVELEVFVHGALCVSYSGQCYASQFCFDRSANRGNCAQFCRMKFDLLNAQGNELQHQRHFLSLKDLCQIDRLQQLADAGACSFKIEGRLKDVDYVKNVVAAYSQQLDALIAANPTRYRRASDGKVNYAFTPNLQKTFNRGFTHYFLDGRKPNISSFDTPKAIGESVGTVKEKRADSILVAGTTAFANGDGLCYFNASRELEGVRVNRVEGNRLFLLQQPENLHKGMTLYRNHDEAFSKVLRGQTATRKIEICMDFKKNDSGFSLSITPNATRYQSVTIALPMEHVAAQTPQRDNIKRQLTKLGATPFVCTQITIADDAAQCFIPSSQLAALRRDAVDALLSQPYLVAPTQPLVQPQSPAPTTDLPFTYLLNAANERSRAFYRALGQQATAFETDGASVEKPLLMQCRYCLRYALGACLRDKKANHTLRDPLYLRLNDGRRFLLKFDCKNCMMLVYATE